MMRSEAIFFCFVAILKLSCCQNETENVLTLEHSIDENGYDLSFVTEGNNSIIHTETGRLVKNGDDVFLRAEGVFRYTGNDGNVYLMEYTLDENGYQFETTLLDEKDEEGRISSGALASLAGGGLG